MSKREVVVVGAARTCNRNLRRFFEGCADDGSPALPWSGRAGACRRAGGDIGHVVMDNVIPTEPKDAYLSRVSAMDAGIPRRFRHSTSIVSAARAASGGLRGPVDPARRCGPGGGWRRGVHEPRSLSHAGGPLGARG